MMKLIEVPARITEAPPRGREVSDGDGSRNVLKTDITLIVELTRGVIAAASDALVPRLDDITLLVAGDEGHPGLVIDSKVPQPTSSVKIHPREPAMRQKKPAFFWNAAEPIGSPRFYINGHGGGHVRMKWRVTTTKEDQAAIVDFLDADVAVWTDAPDPMLSGRHDDPRQMTMGEAMARSASATRSEEDDATTWIGGDDEAEANPWLDDLTARGIVSALRESGEPMSQRAIERAVGAAYRAVRRRLDALIEAGRVREVVEGGATMFAAVSS